MTTIADEWDDYVENVLAPNSAITPETLPALRMVFFAGAASMFVLLPFCETPDALKREIEDFALGLRGTLQ